MKTFYSILTIPIRPSSQEQLNIGLLLVDERNLLFKFSSKKLEFIKKGPQACNQVTIYSKDIDAEFYVDAVSVVILK